MLNVDIYIGKAKVRKKGIFARLNLFNARGILCILILFKIKQILQG